MAVSMPLFYIVREVDKLPNREEENRNAFINALYNNDMVQISDDLAVELIARYDERQAHIEEMRKARDREYSIMARLSMGFADAEQGGVYLTRLTDH